jgi:hypothetical protein
MVQQQVFIDVICSYHIYLQFAQNSRNNVTRWLRKMTVFLVYVLPCLYIALMTVMQAEIPGQEQGGYGAEPNCFHGMRQVHATADLSFTLLLAHIIHYSILKVPSHDLNSAIGAQKDSGSL